MLIRTLVQSLDCAVAPAQSMVARIKAKPIETCPCAIFELV